MKKDLFDLLKQFIFENAERYEVSPIGEGIIKISIALSNLSVFHLQAFLFILLLIAFK